MCQQVGGNVTAKHGKAELDMRVDCARRAVVLTDCAATKRHMYTETAA